jgi:hypothetical protein
VDETGRMSVYEVSVFDGDRRIALFRGIGYKLENASTGSPDVYPRE